MNIFKRLKFLFGIFILGYGGFVSAAPNMNTLFVQGYLRKISGAAVTDGSYAMTFSIRSGNTYFWTKSFSVSVSGGFFSQSLSGSSSPPYSGGIDSATLVGAASGSLVVNIQSTVDGLPVSFDIQATPVALSLLSDKANAVVAGAITSASFAPSGVLPAWDGSTVTNIAAANIVGTLPTTTFPATLPAVNGANLTSLNASSISSGTLSSSVLPTTISNSTTFNAAGTAVIVTTNATVGGTFGVTGASTLGAMSVLGTTTVNTSGASTTTIGGGSSTGAISIGASTGVQNIAVGGSTGAGAVTVGNTGAAAATIIQGGSTGKVKIGSSGVAVSSVGACTISAFTAALGANAKACTGAPVGAAISCSPSATQGASVVWSSFVSSAGNVTITLSAAGASATWYCMWVVP